MASKLPVEIPVLQDFLKAGVQFGHETKRWNPKMKKFIYSSKNNIHIINLVKTIPLLEKSLAFLTEAARRGPVLFVGSKRQSAAIVRSEAVRAGAYFIAHRWPGGLMTNFKIISKSLRKLKKLEEDFETGVEGRTKYEISKMKTEWERLSRLYEGIKDMTRLPSALVVIDPRYEIGSVVEANRLNIPVVAVTDTNCDPDNINYIVPGNDDALKSIGLFMKLFADATLVGNGGQGVKHMLKDYSKFEVKVIKRTSNKDEEAVAEAIKSAEQSKSKFRVRKPVETEPVVTAKPKLRIKKRAEELVKTVESEKPEAKTSVEKVEKKAEKKVEKKAEHKLVLSSRAEKALKDAGLTVAKAKKMKKEELLEVKGLGSKTVEDILKA